MTSGNTFDFVTSPLQSPYVRQVIIPPKPTVKDAMHIRKKQQKRD